nr:hypothetical protein [Elizabethkingia bruuniana]
MQVENTQDIASTDQDGNFSLRTRVKIPFRIIIKKKDLQVRLLKFFHYPIK